jgi:adenylosuccinate lyase
VSEPKLFDGILARAGAWQAEWRPLRELLVAAGSAAAWLSTCLAGLTVDARAMRANVPAGADAGVAGALVDRVLIAREAR